MDGIEENKPARSNNGLFWILAFGFDAVKFLRTLLFLDFLSTLIASFRYSGEETTSVELEFEVEFHGLSNCRFAYILNTGSEVDDGDLTGSKYKESATSNDCKPNRLFGNLQ